MLFIKLNTTTELTPIVTLLHLLLLLICTANSRHVDDVTVKLRGQGHIEGFWFTTETGISAKVFLGVPFVEAPIGDLRFRAPVPKRPWRGTKLCKDYAPACPQSLMKFLRNPAETSEDCVYLNIIQGVGCTERNLCPVIYYVFGGANDHGGPYEFELNVLVDNFARRNVTLLMPSYRLGPLGFWSTETPEAPGNYALQDLILGLEWTKKYIGNFGGDAERVTIMGHSSGAELVSLLTLLPRTEGLFQRALIMSGSTAMPLSVAKNSHYEFLAQQTGCNANNRWHNRKFAEIVDCLREIPADELIETYSNPSTIDAIHFFGNDFDDLIRTTPTVDGEGGIVPDTVENLLKRRRPMPLLIGSVTKEFDRDFHDKPSAAATLWHECRKWARRHYDSTFVVGNACYRYYTQHAMEAVEDNGNGAADLDYRNLSARVMDDAMVFVAIYNDASAMHDVGGRVFVYEWEYSKPGFPDTPYHAFDLYLIMGLHYGLYNWTAGDQRFMNRFVDLLLNFVRFGHPTPECKIYDDHGPPNLCDTKQRALTVPLWEPMDDSPCLRYYGMDLERVGMKCPYHYDGVVFWNEIAPLVNATEVDNQIRRGNSPPISQNLQLAQSLQKQNLQSDSNSSSTAPWVLGSITVALCLTGLALALVLSSKRRNYRKL